MTFFFKSDERAGTREAATKIRSDALFVQGIEKNRQNAPEREKGTKNSWTGSVDLTGGKKKVVQQQSQDALDRKEKTAKCAQNIIK